MMNVTFFGATDGVTGSKFLLELNNKKILIDCGLFQGTHEEEKLNWQPFPFEAKTIDALILTHSHIDHMGLLAKLYKDGFRGAIYTIDATADLARIFLPDSYEILQHVAQAKDVPELFSLDDIQSTLELIKNITYHQKITLFDNVYATFYDAGHILGSAIVKIETKDISIIFSGDLGNPPVPIIKDTEMELNSDYVVMESTYGDQIHTPGAKRIDQLEQAIEDTYTKGGTLLIPAFAMERTQELLYELNELVRSNRIPKMPIYIDSPLAIKATSIYPKYEQYFDDEARKHLNRGEKIFNFPECKMISSVDESKAIDHSQTPKIIIAGSGMSTGGRILFHEKVYLSDPKNTILIIGYQVRGSLGRRLQDGEKRVTILGGHIQISAEVKVLNSYSAHADQPKLLYWLAQNKSAKKVFLVHGEDQAKKVLMTKIKDDLGLETILPKYQEKFTL